MYVEMAPSLQAPDGECFECCAVISDQAFVEWANNQPERIAVWETDGDGIAQLDRVWHEQLRPMAALACLIEEADDCSA